MTAILYTTRELVSLYDHSLIDRPTAFIRDRFFSNVHTSDVEEVVFDKINSSRKIAPLVAPNKPGKMRQHRGSTAKSFVPPYVKPKNAIRPKDSIKRRPGEVLPQELSQEQRRDYLIQDRMEDQDWEITRREELMCANVIKTGKVEFTGQEDHPDVSIDYERDAALTVTLAGATRWGEAGVSPLESIKGWAKTVGQKKGGVVQPVLLGVSAADLLLKDADVKEILDNRRQASGSVELSGFAGEAPGFHGVYLGSVGQYSFWQYQQTFENEDGTDLDVWPEYGVGLIGTGHSGWMCYGAIQDEEGLMEATRFPKMWPEKDPSATYLMTQAAPLAVLENANSTFFGLVR